MRDKRPMTDHELTTVSAAYDAALNVMQSSQVDPMCMVTLAALIVGSVSPIAGGVRAVLADVCQMALEADEIQQRQQRVDPGAS